MLSDEECREIWRTALARCHPTNDISVADVLAARAAYALGVERASKTPDAATRAVIESLADRLESAEATMAEIGNMVGYKCKPSTALIAEARKLLEDDALSKPASEDAYIKATLECVRECERECQKTGVGSCVMVNSILNPAHPDVCNAENCKSIKAMIEAAKGGGK